MSDHLYWFTITVPALTAIASPATTAMVFNAADVDEIKVVVPPGPAGSVGFQVWNGGGPFIPQSAGQYIVADDYTFELPQEKAPNNGNWSFVAYNTDFIPHTLQVGFAVSDFVIQQVPTSALVGL